MPQFIIDILTIFSQERVLFVLVSGILGLIFGSFLNVVIYRLPKMMAQEWENDCSEFQNQTSAKTSQSELEATKKPQAKPPQEKYNLIAPRSACSSCGQKISAIHNIPVVSYLLLKGKCNSCKAAIGMRYPLIEILTAALLGLAGWKFGVSSITLAAWVLLLSLITLAFIDYDTQLLPDSITLPLLWLGLLFNLNTGFTDLNSAVLGAIFGYVILWLVYWMFKLVTGKEGMGYGDFKLLAALGAWFGWQLLPAIILISSLLGAVIGIGLMLLKQKNRNTAIPFGPFLAIGGIMALFFGSQLARFYTA